MERAPGATKEYSVKLCTDQATRSHIMRFPMPGGLDVTKLENPRLERQLPVGVVQEETAPEYGAGSEYGKKQREEARKRKRGVFRKAQSADDFPWLLRSGKKKDKSKFTGRKEGGVQQSASYYLFREVDGDTFEAVPVHSWYNFTPNISYDTLTAEEAEEQFDKRHKTLNHFAVMMQKRLQDSGEAEEATATSEPLVTTASGGRNLKSLMGDSLQVREDEEWIHSDSDSDGSGSEGHSKPKKTKAKSGKGKGKKKKADNSEESEQGDDESDDEDVKQSKEVDYMSDSESSDEEKSGGYAADEEPKVAKKKEQDDENSESQSDIGSEEESSDDDLTKSGRETKKLLSKREGTDGSSEEEEDEEEDYDQLAKKIGQSKQGNGKAGVKGGRDSPKPISRSSTPVPSPAPDKRGKTPSKGKTKSSVGGLDEPAAKKKKPSGSASGTAATSTSASSLAASSSASSSQSKGGKDEVTEEAVRRYLSRKPMTTKDLLKKFKGKTDMDGEKLVMVLGEILRKIDLRRENVRGNTLLSIKP